MVAKNRKPKVSSVEQQGLVIHIGKKSLGFRAKRQEAGPRVEILVWSKRSFNLWTW